MLDANPLLSHALFPLFDAIKPEQIKPAVESLLQQNQTLIQSLLPATQPTWENLIAPLEEANDQFSHAWSMVKHLKSVIHSDDLTHVYSDCLPLVTDYFTQLSQNHELYQAYQQLAESAFFSDLTQAQKKAIEHALRDFKLSGVHLSDAKKKDYAAIVKRLSSLETQFEDNLIKATDQWCYTAKDEKEVSGIPEYVLEKAAQLAAEKGLIGWQLGLDFPTYYAVMCYADDRALRQKMYTAYVTRASDQGPCAAEFDNTPVMSAILAERYALAQTLGFANYAELSLATKMAKTTDEVLDFLNDLVDRGLDQAKQEVAELVEFAKETAGVIDFSAWDTAYFSEKLKTYHFSFSEEEVRQYFNEPCVLNGLFTLANQLFGITITAEAILHAWHPSVRLFSVKLNETIIGYFYLDLYARLNKRSGAWMDECQVRRQTMNQTVQLPIAHIVCNFNQPTTEQPSLLSHDEVMTLFHEFGHSLQHLLTTVDVASVSGINGIAWDAVELPSQFMEHWCWHWDSVQLISSHYKTKASLPKTLFDKMTAARHFQAGMQLIKQLEYSLFDFHLHCFYDGKSTEFIQTTLNTLRKKLALLPIPSFNRFQHSFSHIFSGSYAAGYYSYLWAEVLACDAFAKFAENGYLNPKIGEQFRHTILALGGSQDAKDVFYAFRGRNPTIDALLQDRGIGQSLKNDL